MGKAFALSLKLDQMQHQAKQQGATKNKTRGNGTGINFFEEYSGQLGLGLCLAIVAMIVFYIVYLNLYNQH